MGITFTKKPTTKRPDTEPEDIETNAADKTSGKGNKPAKVNPKKLRNDLLPKVMVQIVPIPKLVPARHPVRKPSKSQVARVARSIRSLGFRNPPLICKDGEIVDGHIRVEAARFLGLKEIPCIIVEDLSEEEIRLLHIALNRIQERGEWDESALKLEMAFLLEFEPDLTVTGFEAPEIDRLVLLGDMGSEEQDTLDKLVGLPNPDAMAVTLNRPGFTGE